MEKPKLAVVQYIKIRKRFKELSDKLVNEKKYFNLNWAALQLGIKINDIEMASLMDYIDDFILYESHYKGVRCIKLIMSETENYDKKEMDIIYSMNNFVLSIFETIKIEPEESLILLKDVITGKEYWLIDKALSSMSSDYLPELLCSFRLILIAPNVYMTSGFIFAFHKKDKQKILNSLAFEKLKKNTLNSSDMFIWLFKKNRQLGVATRMMEF